MTNLQAYLEKSYGIDPNTSATIFITLFIFLVGIVIQQSLSFFGKYMQRRKTRKIFKISLKGFISQVEKQSKEYNKTAQSLSFDKENKFEFKRATIATLSILNDIGYQQTYEAFFFGLENFFKFKVDLKLKAFNKIWDSIKSVEFWHDNSFGEVTQFMDKYNNFNEKRNNATENHRKFFEDIMLSHIGQKDPERIGIYLQAAQRIHTQWQNYPNRTRPNIIHKQLIVRLRILNKKNQDINIANRMNDDLLEASLWFQNQNSLLKAHRNQFVIYSRIFRMYYRLCKKANEIL